MIWIVPPSIPAQTAQVEGLSHNPFPREGSIPVDQNRQSFAHILHRVTGMTAVILGGTGVSFDHGIDEFQMARVVGQGQTGGFGSSGSTSRLPPRWYFTSPVHP